MAEKNIVFSSKVKYEGVFSFSDFYKFCYDYLTDELEFDVIENSYSEKLMGDKKELDIIWKGDIKVDDYFKYEIKVQFRIFNMASVEVEQEGKRKKMNKGIVETKMKGVVVTDYRGEYSTNPMMRFMRNVYERWIIPSKIEKIEEKLIGDCNEFLGQAKSYLDLEGRK